MKPKELANWCANPKNDYFILFGDQVNDISNCPFLRDTVADIVGKSKKIIDISNQAESIYDYFGYEVENSGAILYHAIGGCNEIIVLYYPN